MQTPNPRIGSCPSSLLLDNLGEPSESDRLARAQGLDPEEAKRQALIRFGGVDKYKEEGREERGLYWLDGLSPGIAERLREVGAQVDPALQLRNVVPLSSYYEELRSVWRMMAWAAAIITITVLLLSAAGMHALMSFTIAQRTREIGIRSALGAQPRQLLLGIFGRAMRQLAIGLGVGSVIALATFSVAGIRLERGAALLAARSSSRSSRCSLHWGRRGEASGSRLSTRCASTARSL